MEVWPTQPVDGYPVNQSISVLAVARRGYVFIGWGDLVGTENSRTVLVSDNKVITAIFNPTVTIYRSPSEGGTVALQPVQSSKGYAAGTQVIMTAEPAKGYRFVSWEGDMSTSANPITVTVDAPKTVTARFVEESHSRWWLWVILGVGGVFGALILLRLVYARMSRRALDEPQQPDE